VATLSRPVGDGSVTFTMLHPAAGAVYSCTPVRGGCAMTWSAPRAGSITIAARWSGDRAYKPATATLTVRVRGASYTYSAAWQGKPIGPLTRLVPAVDVPRLPGAHRAGQLKGFRTDDPAYRCLDGHSLAVYTAPRAYPDDDVAYGEGIGSHCPPGAWLFAQGASVSASARHPLTGRPGGDLTVRGTFPATRPDGAVVRFYAGGRLVATAPVRSWSSQAVTARVPAGLDTGGYTARVWWYDRLTGASIQTGCRALCPTGTCRTGLPARPTVAPRVCVVGTARVGSGPGWPVSSIEVGRPSRGEGWTDPCTTSGARPARSGAVA